MADEMEVQGTTEDEIVLNRGQRVLAVLTSPVAAMNGVRANGGWIFPFLAFLVAVLIWVFTAGPFMADEQLDAARTQMQERVVEGQMTQEQADQALEISAQFQTGMGGRIMMLVSTTVIIFLVTLISTALFLLIGNVIHNGHESFGKYWSLSWYAMIPSLLNFILMGIMIMITQDAHGGYLGLAILTKAEPTSALHQAATAVNIFSIWEGIVAGIGLSIFGKIGRGLGIVWGIIVIVAIPALITYAVTSAFAG